jgi:4a-hydroxytetrahydrobiopterin dehydratase
MAARDLLTEEELQAALAELQGWHREGSELVRTFERGSFAGAVALVVRAALLAERQDHHPDLAIQFSKVTFRLTSHDAGGLTRRDLKLARALAEAAGAP